MSVFIIKLSSSFQNIDPIFYEYYKNFDFFLPMNDEEIIKVFTTFSELKWLLFIFNGAFFSLQSWGEMGSQLDAFSLLNAE